MTRRSKETVLQRRHTNGQQPQEKMLSVGNYFFPGKNTRVGCHFSLQGIFLTQGSNLGLPHGRQTLYCLSHKGSSLIIIGELQIKTTMRYHSHQSEWL